MKTNIERPFDLLNSFKGKKILIKLKDKEYSGKLIAFDLNINLVIESCFDIKDNKKIGISFIRGDSIILISEGE